MFCVNCGKDLEEGRRFCISCGAEQAPAPRSTGGMRSMTKVIIGVVAALLVAGAGVGIYLGVRGPSSGNTDSTQSSSPPPPDNYRHLLRRHPHPVLQAACAR